MNQLNILISSEWTYGLSLWINDKQYEYGLESFEIKKFKRLLGKNKGRALSYLKKKASYCIKL